MAKLTTRTELNATPADGDLVHIVDVSDTTDNAAGTSKKITRANLVGGLQAAPAEGAFVDGDKTKLDGIETAADVTDATNVNAAGAVMESDFNQAHSVLAQQSGTGTPGVVNLSDSQLLGKTSGGNVEGQSPTAVRATLNVEDGADVTDVANVTTALASIGVSALSDVDTDKSKTPADGDVLTFDGTDWNAEASAGGGGQTLYDYVLDAGGGGDYTDFSTALAAMSAGESLYVRAGTYTETGTLDNALAGITIVGENPYNTKLVLNSTSNTTWSGASWTLRNIQIENQNSGQWLLTGADSTVENCVFMMTTTQAIYKFSFTGAGSITKISNCHFESTITSEGPRLVRFAGNQQVSNCTFIFAYGSNSSSLGAVYATDQDTVFSNNYFEVGTQTTAGGVLVSHRGSFTGNRINGEATTTTGIRSDSFSAVTGNTISNCLLSINLASGYSSCAGNVIQNTGATSGMIGIDVNQSNHTINGNMINVGSNATAIDLNTHDYNTVIGNVVYATSVGVNIASGGTYNTIIGNAFNNVTTDISDAGSNNLYLAATDSDPLNTT